LVRLHTNMGVIGIELDEARAPNTAKNFLAYVRAGHYDGTIFHRVIDGFMVQGGGFQTGMKQKPTLEPIENEASAEVPNEPYSVAMARTQDPHSATAQFFINVANNEFLNHKSKTSAGWGYCVFGKIVEGQDVVDRIKSVSTATKGFHQDVPIKDVVIERAEEI